MMCKFGYKEIIMKKSTIIALSFILFSSFSFCQDEKVLTKMERFVSNTGRIVKLENFYLPDLKASYEVLKTKVRRATIQDETSYFLILVKEDKYGDKSAAIAEDDLKELVKAFDELNLKNRNILSVIVENQPSLKNPTMKSIQMMVYTYFLINGVCNSDSTIKELEMINARNKLKVYNGPEIKCDITERYKRNKWLAVKYCDYMIQNEKDEFIELFEESKKKDDLSDSYLQGIYYICK